MSGGRKCQRLGGMTEKAPILGDVRTYGMNRTDESGFCRQRVRRKRESR